MTSIGSPPPALFDLGHPGFQPDGRSGQTPVQDPAKKDMWDRAKAILRGVKGSGGIIQRVLNAHGTIGLLNAIEACERENPADPLTYFMACVKPKVHTKAAVGGGLPSTRPRSARYVLERELFPNNPIRIEYVLTSLMPKAREVHFRCDGEGDLARHIGRFIIEIREEMDRYEYKDRPMGSSFLVWCYLDHLSEQQFSDVTVKVLSLDANAFAQFRGQTAYADAYGRDPITGKSRYS